MREIKFKLLDNGMWIYRDLSMKIWCNSKGKFVRNVNIKDKYLDIKQFTGLKVNKIELYSGDIVKWGHIPGFEEFIPRIAVVKLFPSLHFSTVNLGDNNHDFHYGDFAYARQINKALEIIGNTHQNPELLK